MPNYTGLKQNTWGATINGGGTAILNRTKKSRKGNGRSGSYNKGPPRPRNSKDDIPFVPLDENAKTIDLKCSSDNIVAFHGFDSVFTSQHSFPVLIDKQIYTSCDHYYQIQKVTDLMNTCSEKLLAFVRDENGKLVLNETSFKKVDKKSYSSIAREVLKSANIEKEKIDKWRNTKGLEATQKAFLAKVSQSAHLREALKETGDQILVQAYPGDSIYGSGCTVPKIKEWLDGLSKTGIEHLKVPATFPMTEESVKTCPVFAQGRNILGVILMQLREKVRNNEIQIVDMSRIFNALRVNEQTEAIDVSQPTVNAFHNPKEIVTPGQF